jgi:hypothetical protein
MVMLTLGILRVPPAAEAQPWGNIPRVGVLDPGSPQRHAGCLPAFQQGLRDLGYVEGQHVRFAYRYAEEQPERLPVLAGVTIVPPKRKPRGGELTPPEKATNRRISSIRIRIEHAIGGVKRDRMVKDKIRLFKDGIRDTIMETCCGLQNFRLQYRPWCYASYQILKVSTIQSDYKAVHPYVSRAVMPGSEGERR